MRAMVLEAPRTPLFMREWPTPEPKQGEILVELAACGVCRTDLHVVDGELQHPKPRVVPGHEIVGCIAAIGGTDRGHVSSLPVDKRLRAVRAIVHPHDVLRPIQISFSHDQDPEPT